MVNSNPPPIQVIQGNPVPPGQRPTAERTLLFQSSSISTQATPAFLADPGSRRRKVAGYFDIGLMTFLEIAPEICEPGPEAGDDTDRRWLPFYDSSGSEVRFTLGATGQFTLVPPSAYDYGEFSPWGPEGSLVRFVISPVGSCVSAHVEIHLVEEGDDVPQFIRRDAEGGDE